MSESSFLESAKIAFDEGDCKLALILLRRTTLTSSISAKLLCKILYKAWISGSDEFTTNVVINLYNNIFNDGTIPLLDGFDYVCLAHIYISENALAGALKILNLALLNGFYDNTGIVFQTFSILSKIGSKKDIVEYMNILLDLITMENPVLINNVYYIQSTDLPIYAVYLLAAHYYKVCGKVSDTNYRFQGLLNEAHSYYTLNHIDQHTSRIWFRSYELWMEVGSVLSATSCPLLAEDAYWMAFIANQNEKTPIHAAIALMKRNKRTKDICIFLSKILKMYRWNMLCRNLIVMWEPGTTYRDQFRSEHVKATRIQALFRGYQSRKNLLVIIAAAKQQRESHLKVMKSINRMAQTRVARMLRLILKEWKIQIKIEVSHKQSMAIFLQARFRVLVSKGKIAKMKEKIAVTNVKYLQCLELHRNMLRMQLIQQWAAVAKSHRLRTSADTIKSFIRVSSGKNSLTWALLFVSQLVKLIRRHREQRGFQYWVWKFHRVRKLRAAATLRFWMRNTLLKHRYKKIEEKLAKIVNSLKYQWFISKLTRKKFKLSWKKWRSEYIFIVSKRAKNFIATRLSYIFARHKEKLLLNKRRSRRELIIALNKRYFHRNLKSYFYKMKELHATLIIQRGIRLHQAYSKYRKLKLIESNGLIVGIKKNHSNIKRHWNVWKSLYTAIFQTYINASIVISAWFKRTMAKKLLLRMCCRKHFGGNFVLLMAHYYKKLSFRQFKSVIFHSQKKNSLVKLTRNLEIMIFRLAFSKMKRFMVQQNLVRKSIAVLIIQKFKQKALRVFLAMDTSSASSDFLTKEGCRLSSLLSKSDMKNVLVNLNFISLLRYLQLWIMSYRLKKIKVNAVSTHMAIRFYSDIVNKVMSTHRSAILIQNTFTLWKYKKKYRAKTTLMRYSVEVAAMISSRVHYSLKLKTMQHLKLVYFYNFSTRLKLQCWWRCHLSKAVVCRQRKYCAKLIEFENRIRDRRKILVLSSIMNLITFVCVVRSIEPKMSTPREKKAQFGVKGSRIHFSSSRRITQLTRPETEDFLSEDYNSHVFRLKQSGILILECAVNVLSHCEICYLIENARTVFFQSNCEISVKFIKILSQHFKGDKIIFCGGYLTLDAAREIFYLLHILENPIMLHFCEVRLEYTSVGKICRAIASNLSKAKEIFADTSSLGNLGLSTLIVSLKV